MVGKVEGHELGWSHVVLFSINADQRMLRDIQSRSICTSSIPRPIGTKRRTIRSRPELLVGVELGLSGPCTINPCPPMHQERRLANIVSPLISLPLSFSQRESMSRAPHKAFQTIIVKFQNSLITCIMYTCNPSPILHTPPLASKSEAPGIHQKTNHR